MGVSILVGKYDGCTDAAVLIDRTSNWAFGPVMEADDADEQAAAFLEWIVTGSWRATAAEVFRGGVTRRELPGEGNGQDPRHWSDWALEKLWLRWRDEHVDAATGLMFDDRECACGHHHVEGDQNEDSGCASCGCTSWTPGNRAADRRARDGRSTLV